MKKLLPIIPLLLVTLLPLKAHTEVISEALVPVKKVVITSGDNIPQAGVKTTQLVFSTSGGIGLKNLERIDVVVDREERVQGIRLVYRVGTTVLRSIYIKNIRAFVLEKASTQIGARKDAVHIRVVTVDELTEPW